MKSHLDVLRERRKVLQNPYAFADELDTFQLLSQDKRRLENPYAHIEQTDSRPIARFDGIQQRDKPKAAQLRRRRTEAELEESVRQIQLRLWAKRSRLFGPGDIDPIRVLDPAVALLNEGYEVKELDTLGQFSRPDGVFEVAGLIDKQHKLVQFSRQFARSEQRFTLAHELGHATLHDFAVMHRDRSLDGTSHAIDFDEREANRFATLFLMPAKQVLRAFEARFGASPVRFDERATFGNRAPRGPNLRRAASRRLSTITQHNGSSFSSLADSFGVSVGAMAIRLEELNLFILSNNLPASR